MQLVEKNKGPYRTEWMRGKKCVGTLSDEKKQIEANVPEDAKDQKGQFDGYEEYGEKLKKRAKRLLEKGRE